MKVWIEWNHDSYDHFWFKVIDERGNCLFKSAYKDECYSFCDENNLTIEE